LDRRGKLPNAPRPARRETGLEDFGPDAFLEGLEILVNALRNEAQLNALGEKVLRDRIIGHLRQRLQVEDWYRRHPKIDGVPIRAPLIELSLPRTGPTFFLRDMQYRMTL